MYPVSLALKNFAVSVLSLIPVFALFIAFQRYIVEGISTTGLKG
jgi:multiple sugar transport system permease protein